MTNIISGALYAVALATAFASAPLVQVARTTNRRPAATIGALLVVGLPGAAQFTVAPWLLERLQRDWTLVTAGQIWRLVTSLVVQDGGLPGTAFNLLSLAVIGAAAESLWSWRRWVVLALCSGVDAQLWGALVQPVGAGNSVAVFGLAASLAFLGVRRGDRSQQLLGVASMLASAALLSLGDIHGGASAIGVATAAVLSRSRTYARPSLTD